MKSIRTLSAQLLLAALFVPNAAYASKIVLTPLIPSGVDGKAQLAIHQLIASELEFQPEVTGVEDLDTRPSNLTDSCLTSTSCLSGITGGAGGEQLITGKMSLVGGDYALDLLLYDKATNKIVRRKTFTVSTDPTEMANGMTKIMRELLTGQAPGAEPGAGAVAAAESFDTLAEDDSFAFEPAPAAPRAAAAPVELPPLEDLEDLEEPPSRAAAAAPPPPAPAPAPPPPPPAPAPAPEPEIDPSMITFGGSVEDITAEEIDQMIKFGAPAAVATATVADPQPTYAPPPQPYAPPPQPTSGSSVADLDDKRSSSSKSSPSRSTSRPPSSSDYDGAQYVQITARGGFSKYFAFDFITAGAEVAVPVASGLHVLAGLEAYSVNRQLPVEIQAATGQITDWDHIFPMNLGLMYKFLGGMAQPYVGADTIFVQYYSDDIGADWAGGARGRVGLDVMFVDNFGVNLNAAVGFWSGGNWHLIDQGVSNTGVLPQVSAGTVLAF